MNGLPLVFIELKSSHTNVKNAYDGNLSDYKDTIPQVFWYNALVILSNGSESRIGTISSQWEHFVKYGKWKNPLESISRGVAQPGSAHRSGRWGRRFKSSLPDQLLQGLKCI